MTFELLKKIKAKIRNLPYFYQWILLVKMDEELSTAFSEFIEILPPKDRFWADPCIIKKDKMFYIFFEEFVYSRNKGNLSVIRIDEKGNHSNPVIILERDYHLSYPSFFEFENELYLIHGTIHKSKSSVELFKCEEFPDKWSFNRELIKNIPLVDPTMFYHNKKWWIFACRAKDDGTSNSSELMLFHSSNPIDENWISHPLNPIVSDIKRARPAGKIFEMNNKIIRPAQNCFKIYGNGFSFNEITKLNENEYEEQQIESFKSDWKNGLIGIHTFSYEKGCSVIDARIKRTRFN